LQLPANELTILELRQIDRRPVGPRPDLAFSAEDVELSDDRQTVTVTVHNLGAVPVENVPVIVQTVEGEALGAGRIESLLAPDDLLPKTVHLTIPLNRPAPEAWRVVIDPEGKVEEITKENNDLLFAGKVGIM